MTLVVVTPPAEEVVALAEAKAFCRVEIPDDDTLISGLVTAARIQAETLARRTFVTTTYDLTLDSFPGWGSGRSGGAWNWGAEPIDLPRPPLQSVTSISYLDMTGAALVLPAPKYLVLPGAPARVGTPFGQIWPIALSQPGAVTIRYTAGYGPAASVPENAKLAVKMLVAHWYEHREAVAEGTLAEVPMAVAALLSALDCGSYA